MTNPTLHQILAVQLDEHAYTKGRFKGDAPADPSRRGRTHFRIYERNGAMRVLFHSTEIIIARPDGTVELDSGGWHASPTTRDAYAHFSFYLRSERRGTYSQTALTRSRRYSGPTTPFYDGLTLNPDGTLATPAKPFMQRIADREERREWRDDDDVRAFRAALPVLHAAVSAMSPPERNRLKYNNHINSRRISDACYPHDNWPAIVAMHYRGTPAETWAAYAAEATEGMTKLVEVV
jgi:hypothetical protein